MEHEVTQAIGCKEAFRLSGVNIQERHAVLNEYSEMILIEFALLVRKENGVDSVTIERRIDERCQLLHLVEDVATNIGVVLIGRILRSRHDDECFFLCTTDTAKRDTPIERVFFL